MFYCRPLLLRFLFLIIIVRLACPSGWAAAPASLTVSVSPELGQVLKASQPSFFAHQTEHFTIFHHMDRPWALRMGGLLEEFYKSFFPVLRGAGFAVSAPADRMVWLCFGERKGFNEYAWKADRLPISLEGYYSARTNYVAVFEPLSPFTKASLSPEDSIPAHILRRPLEEKYIHEAAHQLSFNSGFMKRGVMYPLWISEGFATNFETMGLEDYQAIQTDLAMHPNLGREICLAHAKEDRKLLPLKHFLTLTQISAAEDEDAREIYSQAWSLFRFTLKSRPDALKKYLDALSNAKAGWQDPEALRQKFVKSFGPLDRFENEWLQSISIRETSD